MNVPQSHIPTEVYLDFLGRTIQIQWGYHATLMFVVWMVLVPLCIMTIRYGKPKPGPYGIREKIKLANIAWWWFNVHKYVLYITIGLSVVGVAVAMTVSRGLSGSVHSLFESQRSAWGVCRSSHHGSGERTVDATAAQAEPDDPATWHGDHFNMTPRRRLFEAFHNRRLFRRLSLRSAPWPRVWRNTRCRR